VAASILGNVFLMTGFLLVGPARFLPNLVPAVGLIQGSAAILGTGYGLIVVSSFGRSHRAAMRHGFNDDLDTYMFISGEFSCVKTPLPWVVIVAQWIERPLPV